MPNESFLKRKFDLYPNKIQQQLVENKNLDNIGERGNYNQDAQNYNIKHS